METSGIYALSTVATSPITDLLGGWIYNKFKKYRLRKRLSGILLLKGVSTICNKLSNSEVLFFDIDTIYKELTAPKDATEVNKVPSVVENYTAYPILRQHVFNICSVYKGKVIIVSHNLELLRAVGIYEHNIKFYAFSRNMESNIGVIFASETERASVELAKFRYLRELDENNVVLVENLKDVEDKLKLQYNQNKISV